MCKGYKLKLLSRIRQSWEVLLHGTGDGVVGMGHPGVTFQYVVPHRISDQISDTACFWLEPNCQAEIL